MHSKTHEVCKTCAEQPGRAQAKQSISKDSNKTSQKAASKKVKNASVLHAFKIYIQFAKHVQNRPRTNTNKEYPKIHLLCMHSKTQTVYKTCAE